MHQVIYGVTGSGKSTLAKIYSRKLALNDQDQAVLDPHGKTEGGWWTDNIFTDGDRFLQYVKSNQNLFIFVDESPEYMDQHSDEMRWLATNSRHNGHYCTFIAHRPQDIHKTARQQVTRIRLFHVDAETAYEQSRLFTSPSLQYAHHLPRLYFYSTTKFNNASLYKINFPD